MHHEPDLTDSLQERQAHAFAAAFLMPADFVVDDLPRRPPRGSDWEKLKALQRRWGVSISALLYRSRELGTLPEAGFRRAMTRYNQLGMRSYDGDALGPPEEPKLLAQATTALLRHNGWSIDTLADKLCLSPSQLDLVVGPELGSLAHGQDALASVVRLRAVGHDGGS